MLLAAARSIQCWMFKVDVFRFLLAILLALNAVFVIIAAIKASDGKFYRYPMTIRFLQ